MQLTTENIKEYCCNVMDVQQINDFNRYFKTEYSDKEDLIESETNEKLLDFYNV